MRGEGASRARPPLKNSVVKGLPALFAPGESLRPGLQSRVRDGLIPASFIPSLVEPVEKHLAIGRGPTQHCSQLTA